MRLIPLCAAALLLAGCAQSSLVTLGDTGGGNSARPKTVVVTDFAISPDVQIVDRGFTARLERKIGAFPTHERKQRTIERVNDEIVATLIATLRESGLEAEPGSEEGLSLSESALLVKGSLRPADAAARKNEAGIVGTKTGVTADVVLSSFSSFGRKQLLAFTAEPSGGKPPTGKTAAATNALIAEALAANKAAPEKLSPDVEAAGAPHRTGRRGEDSCLRQDAGLVRRSGRQCRRGCARGNGKTCRSPACRGRTGGAEARRERACGKCACGGRPTGAAARAETGEPRAGVGRHPGGGLSGSSFPLPVNGERKKRTLARLR